jgi:hypothetical protein
MLSLLETYSTKRALKRELKALDSLIDADSIKGFSDQKKMDREAYEHLSQPHASIVYGESRVVTSENVFSRDYLYCNAVVLFAEGALGMSHYSFKLPEEMYWPGSVKNANPRNYLTRLIHETRRNAQGNIIGAALIGGDIDHLTLNATILHKENIPIIGAFIDGHSDLRTFNQLPTRTQTGKDVLALPSGEVYVYLQDLETSGKTYSGYVKFQIE